MVELDPELVEKAARAMYLGYEWSGCEGSGWSRVSPQVRRQWIGYAEVALSILVGPLREEGRKQAAAALDFDQTCLNCASTIEKSASAYFDGEKKGLVEGAQRVAMAVAIEVAEAGFTQHHRFVRAADEAVARIEGEYCTDCEQVHTWAEHRTSGPCPACGEETCPVSDDGEACCDACWREVCEHADIRTFRSHPPHSKCLNCGQVVVQRWVTKTGDE